MGKAGIEPATFRIANELAIPRFLAHGRRNLSISARQKNHRFFRLQPCALPLSYLPIQN